MVGPTQEDCHAVRLWRFRGRQDLMTQAIRLFGFAQVTHKKNS
jgi:hypothetical protein